MGNTTDPLDALSGDRAEGPVDAFSGDRAEDSLDAFEGDREEADAEAALKKLQRDRRTTSAQEFVSNRDALEDAWAQDDGDADRDEGW